jgi:hypothetical protein
MRMTFLSNTTFTEHQISLLNKGPSYVPPPPPISTAARIKNKAEIQACISRVTFKNTQLARTSEYMEFINSVIRVNNAAYTIQTQSEKSHKKILNLLKEIKTLKTPILPSDKTKRLIAMETTDYELMLKNSLNKDDPTTNTVLPSTRQQKINAEITRIAEKYNGNDLRKVLIRCKTSEPLPSSPYALPKDHKPGELKGRPIISTVNSGVRPLSQFLANLIQPLIKTYVPAHLSSTSDFLNSISSISMNDQLSFGSLDVTNLYGSIPLEDNNGEPGLITVMTNFFSDHHQSSIYPELHPIDFTQLLRVTLYEDVYAHQNVTKKQTKGIAMGNCAAPPLAIIYMQLLKLKSRVGASLSPCGKGTSTIYSSSQLLNQPTC